MASALADTHGLGCLPQLFVKPGGETRVCMGPSCASALYQSVVRFVQDAQLSALNFKARG